jgi:hypothetical protein
LHDFCTLGIRTQQHEKSHQIQQQLLRIGEPFFFGVDAFY